MKFASIIASLALLGLVSVEAIQIKSKVEATQTERLFANFVSKFSRSYKSNDEFNNRLSNFAKNLELVNSHNAKNLGFELELNKFADLSNQEFKSMLGFRADLVQDDDDSSVNVEVDEQQTYPASVDWRTKTGIVAPVKNQGSCGSCYSFASMEALQSLYHIKKGPFTNSTVLNLSEQQIVDCSTAQGNQGCNGGLMEYVYTYLKSNPIQIEADYAYTGKKGTCVAKAAKGLFKVNSYSAITKNNPTAHVAALQTGPTTIALAASSSAFQLYKSGILSTGCGTTMDHAVVLVGYGTENGKDYWIVKNSWGATWGEAGFIRIARDMSGTTSGVCGLLQHTIQPTAISI